MMVALSIIPNGSVAILGRTAAAKHQVQRVAPQLVLGVIAHAVLGAEWL